MPALNILITNDDGFDAPGLAALKSIAEEIGIVFVAAPAHQYSGCGHQLSLHKAIPIQSLEDRSIVIEGTPADCSRIGISHFKNIDWVFSGINDGGNLGVDTYMSGTVASAREAAFSGIPALAISQYRRDPEIQWSESKKLAELAIHYVLQRNLPSHSFWNINLPARGSSDPLPPIVESPCDRLALDTNMRIDDGKVRLSSTYHNRPRTKDHDVDVCFSGAIAVTRFDL